MPPKSDQKEVKQRAYLGRPSTHVKAGIVGMPNIGKSSLFNLLSKLNVPAENYPFCTIEPTDATVPVPDERFDFLVQHYKPKKNFQAVLTITDIAGLVKGAAEGRGLGNAFLSNIQQVDAILHVVRAFADTEIQHVEGDVDPVRDLEIISEELCLKDLSVISNKYDAIKKLVERGADKTKQAEYATLTKAKKLLEDHKDIREGEWDPKEIEVLNMLNLLTAKPIVYLVNVSETNYVEKKNKWLPAIKQWIEKRSPGAALVPFSVPFEQKLLDMPTDKDRTDFLTEKKLVSATNRIITGAYTALQLIHFFTAGEDEVKAWSVRDGFMAPRAGKEIHGDFEQFFISVDVMAFADLKELGGEVAVRKAGKLRSQGKTYVVKDGDILEFKIGGGGKGKK